MLDRESLLTQAKLHALEFDRSQGMQQLQRLRSQIRQVSYVPGTWVNRFLCVAAGP